MGGPPPHPPTPDEHAEAHQAATDAAFYAHETAHAAAMDAAKAAADAVNASGAKDYLETIGSYVAAALDPFGIDVDVAVETPHGGKTTVSSSSSTSSTVGETKEEKTPAAADNGKPAAEEKPAAVGERKIDIKVEEEKMEPAVAAATPAESEDEAKDEDKSRSPSRSASEDGDWTLVKDDEPEVPKVLYADTNGVMYPELPKADQPAQAVEAAPTAPAAAATAPPKVAHPDPKIQVALQAMVNMGFSNEGGWLTSLLEAKDG